MFNNIPPVTRNIIIINVLMFILTSFMMPQLYNTLSGFYPFSPNFKSWQIITHMFMHGGLMHILFNMLTLWSFGPILEQSLGEKKYLILYFASGLGAFFLFNLWNFIEVQQIVSGLESLGLNAAEIYQKSAIDYSGNLKISATTPEGVELSQKLYVALRTPMVGASGAIFGVVAAFATLYPDAKIAMMFIPIPMKVKYLMPVVIVVSIFLGVSGNVGGIAHLAHVGGALVGWILARIWRKHLYRFN
ncbi:MULTISPECIES: rhomboid family intramembrane serine protease [Chryseobacterium]|jgi:membrane associated rhomboid family serine protease|uniref:Membrane associated rhomboid family serine protease n=1 Tax=Chryseobacterium geocarposphaerae TaxID=1416776 RepID=A0ABU1LEE3_9FLAO|nr:MULTISPECIES: rhomboid family intramembrane serine protease [Chryseobacterium]MDR6405086.1 membrane associated rhomboid family serine protease [Chryseobacterium geocarposphaerae]MDR6697869.1 membrane associated rhomboid family serine protease [Chryseobacterium ginsenosidimutans]